MVSLCLPCRRILVDFGYIGRRIAERSSSLADSDCILATRLHVEDGDRTSLFVVVIEKPTRRPTAEYGTRLSISAWK
jgi:hypothetical protein